MKHQRALGTRSNVSVRSRSNWNLVVLVFVEGGKPENPEKNPRSWDENQQQTQPTYDAESGNRTRATLVGGECSHHCAIPASEKQELKNNFVYKPTPLLHWQTLKKKNSNSIIRS